MGVAVPVDHRKNVHRQDDEVEEVEKGEPLRRCRADVAVERDARLEAKDPKVEGVDARVVRPWAHGGKDLAELKERAEQRSDDGGPVEERARDAAPANQLSPRSEEHTSE